MAVQNTLTDRQVLETKIKNARSNLLLVVVFTVVNILLLITDSSTYFLFSAYIPYILTDLGMLLCGMYPAEFYDEYFPISECLDTSAIGFFLGIALVMVALYLVSWIFSKKNKVGWLVFALVIFAVDTAGMLLFVGFALDSIVDIVFHVWVIISLSLGINACSKLKKLPPDEEAVPEVSQVEDGCESQACSTMIRYADLDVKARVFLETEVSGHTVTYRRVKKVNELVVDGKVYDEMEALVEMPHVLKARIDGHLIEAGLDNASRSYLNVDGQRVAKKLRLY